VEPHGNFISAKLIRKKTLWMLYDEVRKLIEIIWPGSLELEAGKLVADQGYIGLVRCEFCESKGLLLWCASAVIRN
jgi:hypothetical protein